MNVGTFLELSEHVVKLKITFRVLKVNLREHSGRKKHNGKKHTKIKGENIRKAETQNNCLFSIYLAQIPEEKKKQERDQITKEMAQENCQSVNCTSLYIKMAPGALHRPDEENPH